MKEQEQVIEPSEVVVAEPQQGTEMATIMEAGDVDVMLATLEKKAALAKRFKEAQDTILASQTYPEDWIKHGDKMCLGSAGAERVGRLFGYRINDVSYEKEKFTDKIGTGYRYIYSGTITMDNRQVFAIGQFSTRDKFLGYKDGEWRTLEEINENNIRQAAYHIFIGNALKSMLGLRGIPEREWNVIMNKIGSDSSKATSVRRGSGTKGGTSQDDSAKQKELAESCIAIIDAGYYAELYQGKWKLCQQTDFQCETAPIELAKSLCVELSSFDGKEGKVTGLPASKLKGKRLDITLNKANELKGGI